VLIASGLTLYYLKRWPTVRAVMMFFGIVLVGQNGHLVAIGGKLAGIVERLGAAGLVWAVGVPVAGLLTLVLGIVMIHDWLPKNAAKARTFWISILMGLMVAAGTTGIPALASFPQATRTSVTQTTGVR